MTGYYRFNEKRRRGKWEGFRSREGRGIFFSEETDAGIGDEGGTDLSGGLSYENSSFVVPVWSLIFRESHLSFVFKIHFLYDLFFHFQWFEFWGLWCF